MRRLTPAQIAYVESQLNADEIVEYLVGECGVSQGDADAAVGLMQRQIVAVVRALRATDKEPKRRDP